MVDVAGATVVDVAGAMVVDVAGAMVVDVAGATVVDVASTDGAAVSRPASLGPPHAVRRTRAATAATALGISSVR